VLVKLTRTVAIVPVVAALAAAGRRGVSWRKVVPWFLVWFAAAAASNTAGAIPARLHHPLQELAVVLITVALGAIGLSTRLAHLRTAGARPLLLGTLVWVAVAGTSLAVQAATGA
jgi:uncharacterized membrane protein YadS